ncbi:hypothetical protein EFY79_07765 [Hanamia caeni]|uniref:Uncharacterized protein n=1 Tax=Hanamia caeni TaxID=2294116 RepID=A0A3M9NJV7_9BACT|nr:hypothetical protein EFY79_07765 [Hanamia caeni]
MEENDDVTLSACGRFFIVSGKLEDQNYMKKLHLKIKNQIFGLNHKNRVLPLENPRTFTL